MRRSYASGQNVLWVAGYDTTQSYAQNSDANIPRTLYNRAVQLQTRFGFRIFPRSGFAQFPIKCLVTYADTQAELVLVESSRWQPAAKPIQQLQIIPNEVMDLVSGPNAPTRLSVDATVLLNPMWAARQANADGIFGDFEIHAADYAAEVRPDLDEKIIRSFMLCSNYGLSNVEVDPTASSAPNWKGSSQLAGTAPLLTPLLGTKGLLFLPANAKSIRYCFYNSTGAPRVITPVIIDTLYLQHDAANSGGFLRHDVDVMNVVDALDEVDDLVNLVPGAPQLYQLVSDAAPGAGTQLRVNAYVTMEL